MHSRQINQPPISQVRSPLMAVNQSPISQDRREPMRLIARVL
jgi:hypothetical protein